MKFNISICFLLGILLYITFISAQTVQRNEIFGRIIGESGRGIPNIIVYIDGNGQNSYSTTDDYGNFKFKMLPGLYNITFKNLPEFDFKPTSLKADIKNKSLTNITIKFALSNKGKKDIQKAKKLLDDALKAGLQLTEIILTVSTRYGGLPIAAVLYGDPTLALPPGVKVYYGTGYAVMIKGKVVLGDKSTRITDLDYGY